VLPQGFGVSVYPGRGDFTFDPPVPITTPAAVDDAIVADLNNDGRSDIVTATASTVRSRCNLPEAAAAQ